MKIVESDLEKAREDWGNGLVSISKKFESEGIEKASELASLIIEKLYDFDNGPVLFKPTLSGGDQTFRLDQIGALSYFVGHNPKYPKDGGFGIKCWREVKSHTAAQFIDGNIAMWMGWVTLTDKEGKITKVDKSWGYKMDTEGKLKIVLHHSSLPYTG